jgi:hypothetical protein
VSLDLSVAKRPGVLGHRRVRYEALTFHATSFHMAKDSSEAGKELPEKRGGIWKIACRRRLGEERPRGK